MHGEGFSHEQLCMICNILCYNCLTEAVFLSFIIYHFNRVYNDINYIISGLNSKQLKIESSSIQSFS